MAASFTIRRATEADARAVAEIHVAGWQWAYRGHMPDAYLDALSVEHREAKWRTTLGNPDVQTQAWLAERDGCPLGFVVTGRSRNPDDSAVTAELGAFYLRPDVVGTGIGRALHEHAVEGLRERGFRHVILWVLSSNARARRFYEAAGWRPDGASKLEPKGEFSLHELRYSLELAD